MAIRIREIPKGFHTATPNLTLADAARAIDFYKRAFGAEELLRVDGPDGKIVHAEIKIGDSIIMLADEMPGFTRSSRALANLATNQYWNTKPDPAAPVLCGR